MHRALNSHTGYMHYINVYYHYYYFYFVSVAETLGVVKLHLFKDCQ